MKLIIDHMSHAEYDLLIAHLEKYSKLNFESDGHTHSPLRIDKVGSVDPGNPPVYRIVEIKAEEGNCDGRTLNEALKGLIDIVFH
jgi:hypothetical protein